MVVGTCQSFQFFRQKAWFLENNTGLSKFPYAVSRYLISYLVTKKMQAHICRTLTYSKCNNNLCKIGLILAYVRCCIEEFMFSHLTS